jgi:hypothetical protein
MNFKENQKIELHIPIGHSVDGKHPVVEGRITKLMHGHAIVCFESITEGLRLAVKPSGQLVVLGKMDILEKDWEELKTGDIEAVPLADLVVAIEDAKPAPEWITREQALFSLSNLERAYGDVGKLLDDLIERGTVKHSLEGLLRTSDISQIRAAFPTYAANYDKEHRKFSDEAKEFNRLGSQLHPEIFGKAW